MPIATDQFVTQLKVSRLLTPEQMAEVQRFAEGRSANDVAAACVNQKWLTRWQAVQIAGGQTRFFLGKYRLLDLLGTGGSGNVFLGEHTLMRRRVAIKVLALPNQSGGAKLKSFLAEAQAIAALDHRNIVRAFNVDYEGALYYLVMEYVEGEDLEKIVERDGPLPIASAVNFIRQAADGLGHAHERGIVHRDVKPANLLVGGDDIVKVLDMGLAMLADAPGSMVDKQGAQVGGSADFMAPEQALGERELDARADIYGLGCTLYYLLTARVPFPAENLAQAIVKHQTSPPPDLCEYRLDAPEDLAEICKSLMAKQPEERIQTAAELSELLQNWLTERGYPCEAGHRTLSLSSSGTDVRRNALPVKQDEQTSSDDELSSFLTNVKTTGIEDRLAEVSADRAFLTAGIWAALIFGPLILGIGFGVWMLRWNPDEPPPAATKPAPKVNREQFVDDEIVWPGAIQTPDEPEAKGKAKAK